MRKIVSLFSVLMLFCALAYGQARTVTGVVRDEKGNPIPLATIREAGRSTTTVADGNGMFSIKINSSKLIISSSGFTEREVEVSDGFQTIILTANQNLQEVVVTALGIRRKSESIGYSTTRVSPEQITAGRSANLAQSLSGKVSGLTISNTSAAVNATPRIVLRGLRSLTGDNTALIVLDGVPVPANTINYLNPNDVDRIDVLKGGQAATLFGPEGVNGALVITTKKGSQKPQITITHSSNYEQLAYLPKTQHSFGSGSAYGSSIDEDFHPAENQQYGPRYDGSIRPLGRQLQDGSVQLVPYSDIENVRRKYWATGYTGQSDVSYRAGDATGNFYVSFQNLSSKGIVEGDRFNRNSFRINSNKMYGKFNLSFDANYTWDHANRTATDFYFWSLNSASWAPIDQYRDWRNNKFGDLSGYFNDYVDNPWWLLDNSRNDTRNNYFNGNVKLSYKPIKSLEFTLRAALANTNTYVTSYANNYRYTGYTRSSAFVNYFNNNYDRVLTGTGRSSVARNDRT
ncbi:MAG TPA: TonB-dependent receptor plug domain-containing protein, partial [Flavisolibacter sp.]|nr:TonB-dependent receptor plug domain-containing protein [Flavisolibacter sp.]